MVVERGGGGMSTATQHGPVRRSAGAGRRRPAGTRCGRAVQNGTNMFVTYLFATNMFGNLEG